MKWMGKGLITSHIQVFMSKTFEIMACCIFRKSQCILTYKRVWKGLQLKIKASLKFLSEAIRILYYTFPNFSASIFIMLPMNPSLLPPSKFSLTFLLFGSLHFLYLEDFSVCICPGVTLPEVKAKRNPSHFLHSYHSLKVVAFHEVYLLSSEDMLEHNIFWCALQDLVSCFSPSRCSINPSGVIKGTIRLWNSIHSFSGQCKYS